MKRFALILAATLLVLCSCEQEERVPVEGLELDYTTLELTKGQTFKLQARKIPYYATDELKWSSSNESVATVEAGLVTTVSNGTAIIKVTAGALEATCSVLVRDIPEGAIDLGVVVKRKDFSEYTIYWADCNLGASAPEDYGDYYAWADPDLYYTSYTIIGEITGYIRIGAYLESDFESVQFEWVDGKTGFNKESYKWYELIPGDTQDELKVLKYQESESYIPVIELEDDAARVKLGGSWRIPTIEEIEALIDQCVWEWTTINGIPGYRVSSQTNGNSIFLPAAGMISNYSKARSFGDYWSSTLSHGSYGYALAFDSDFVDCYFGSREHGLPIRPVTQ